MDAIQVIQALSGAADKIASSVREEVAQRMVQIVRGEAEFALTTLEAPGVRILVVCGDSEGSLAQAVQVASESAKGYLAGVCGQPEDEGRDLEAVHQERMEVLASMQDLVSDLLQQNFAGTISADKAKSALLWTVAAWPEKVVV